MSAAAGIAFLPMGREPRAARDYFVQGRPEGQPGERPQAEVYAITSDYFKTLEIPVRAGRDFDRTDTPERPRVAIINETLARAAFPGESPLGQHIRTNSRSPWMEIVGVVGDTRWQDPSHPAPSVIFVVIDAGRGQVPVHPGSDLAGREVARKHASRAPARRKSHRAGPVRDHGGAV